MNQKAATMKGLFNKLAQLGALALVLALCMAQAAQAKDIYVSPSGSTSGTGARTAPFLSPCEVLANPVTTSWGDTIKCLPGVYELNNNFLVNIAGTDTKITLEADQPGTVTFLLSNNSPCGTLVNPTGDEPYIFLGTAGKEFIFKGITFAPDTDIPSGAKPAAFFKNFTATSTGAFTLQDCVVDGGGVMAYALLSSRTGGTSDVVFKAERTIFKNFTKGGTGGAATAIIQTTSTAASTRVELESCLVHDFQKFLRLGTGTLELKNCTFSSASDIILQFQGTATTDPNPQPKADIANCIFDGVANANTSIIRAETDATTYLSANATDPSVWSLRSNVFYRDGGLDNGSGNDGDRLTNLITWAGDIPLIGITNRFVDPKFTNKGSDDYTLAPTGYVHGYGSEADLPATPLGGGDWGNTRAIGCYANPAGQNKPPFATSPFKVAFIGDSIMVGFKSDTNNVSTPNARSVFAAATGLTVLTAPNDAQGGADSLDTFWRCDQAIFGDNQGAGWGFFATGVNDALLASQTTKVAQTISQAMKKFQYYGGVPMWLGIGSLTGVNNFTATGNLNTALTGEGVTNGWKTANFLTSMQARNDWRSFYYQGGNDTTGNIPDVHPNTAGQQLYASLAQSLLTQAQQAGQTPSLPTAVYPSSSSGGGSGGGSGSGGSSSSSSGGGGGCSFAPAASMGLEWLLLAGAVGLFGLRRKH